MDLTDPTDEGEAPYAEEQRGTAAEDPTEELPCLYIDSCDYPRCRCPEPEFPGDEDE